MLYADFKIAQSQGKIDRYGSLLLHCGVPSTNDVSEEDCLTKHSLTLSETIQKIKDSINVQDVVKAAISIATPGQMSYGMCFVPDPTTKKLGVLELQKGYRLVVDPIDENNSSIRAYRRRFDLDALPLVDKNTTLKELPIETFNDEFPEMHWRFKKIAADGQEVLFLGTLSYRYMAKKDK